MNKKLAITIPCRNTAYLLEENIPKILEAIEPYSQDVNVYIFDNSDDNLVEKLYEKIKKKYTNLFYYKSKKILTPDQNFLECYSIPKEEFIWLLGDGFYFNEKDIKRILNCIQENYDYINFKAYREINILSENKEYNNMQEFFSELAWHATLAGSTILKRELIEYMLKNDKYTKYLDSNFIQLGFLLEGGIIYSSGLYLNEQIIKFNLNKKESTWHNKVFEVFGIDWINFINSLPEFYDSESKIKVIKMHGIESKFFKTLNLLNLRKKNKILSSDYSKYKKIFSKITDTNLITFKLICFMPIRIINIIYILVLNLDRLKRVIKNPKLLKKYLIGRKINE